jgi:hypothetical protein
METKLIHVPPLSVVDVLYPGNPEFGSIHAQTFVLTSEEFYSIKDRDDVIKFIVSKGFENYLDFRAHIGQARYKWTLPGSQEKWMEAKFGDRFDYEFDVDEAEE